MMNPRIAVDGFDNVHIIAWRLINDGDWLTNSRCSYARRPAGGDRFEPAVEFSKGRDQDGGSFHGALTVDSSGDLHIFYESYHKASKPKRSSTHFIRYKNGAFGAKVDSFRSLSTDFGMSAVVDAKGVLHVAGQDATEWGERNPKAPIYWTYFNNAKSPDRLEPVRRIPDRWEFATDLLLTPSGDLWMSRGHWQADEPFPWLGRYTHLDATTKAWTEPVNVSPPGTLNGDKKYGQVPKFVFDGSRVHLFYAAQAPGQPFGFFQRTWAALGR
jgi:hypothetical protein